MSQKILIQVQESTSQPNSGISETTEGVSYHPDTSYEVFEGTKMDNPVDRECVTERAWQYFQVFQRLPRV